MPALAKAINAFQVVRSAAAMPAFSGVNGQIDMTHGQGTKSGQKVDEAGALRVAAIWIATTILADEIASLTLRLVKKDDANRTPVQPPQLRAFWGDEPNPDQTRFGIEATETLSLVLWGASYTMLGWTNAGVLDVRWPIDPNGVKLDRADDGGLILDSPMGQLRNRPNQRPEFSFVPRYTLPGKLTPVSPVRMAAELAGLALAYEETAARFMGRGMNPSALLTGDFTRDAATEYTDRLSRLHGGAGNAGKIAAVGGKDVKLERLSMSMADAEFVAQNDRAFQVLLAMWRVPATVAGMVDRISTWGTGVAEFSKGLERFTLRPIVQLRQAASRKYITNFVDPDLQVKYIFDSLLSAAPKDRAEIQRTRLMMGATSIERVLAQEDEPPFAEDETVYSQLALATDEDRQLQRLTLQAEAFAALIAAGVLQEDAAAATGFDPKKLRRFSASQPTIGGA